MYFLLLVLKIPIHLSLDIGCKKSKFSKTLLEKSFEFILNKRGNIITLNLGFLLLQIKVNPISEKQIYKKDVLIAYDNSYIKMIFAILIKLVVFYIKIFLI